MKPSSRIELIEYGLRQLGAPILEINIADEQIDDVLDDTIQYFQERNFNGVVRTYLKYQFTKEDIERGYDYNPFYQAGISTTAVTYPGATGPTVDKFVENSNYIKIPDHIIGIEKVMVPPNSTGGGAAIGNPWGLGPGASPILDGAYGYLGGIGAWGGNDIVTYYIARQWWAQFNMLFNPQAPIRFNQRQDRLYLDINWGTTSPGQVIIIDCYRALDPVEFTQVYNDPWVKRYFTAALKKQWGQNLIKFRGTKLPGGIEMNGREIYDDGVRELEEIKRDRDSFEMPPLDCVG